MCPNEILKGRFRRATVERRRLLDVKVVASDYLADAWRPPSAGSPLAVFPDGLAGLCGGLTGCSPRRHQAGEGVCLSPYHPFPRWARKTTGLFTATALGFRSRLLASRRHDWDIVLDAGEVDLRVPKMKGSTHVGFPAASFVRTWISGSAPF